VFEEGRSDECSDLNCITLKIPLVAELKFNRGDLLALVWFVSSKYFTDRMMLGLEDKGTAGRRLRHI